MEETNGRKKERGKEEKKWKEGKAAVSFSKLRRERERERKKRKKVTSRELGEL